ncbi:huntingtin-interacting protein k [Quercus suber]|uniref:Huntingtin-interacting protein k n=1 Tax=Quercus suber TaxID=58331 RepID=A0AAW0JB20_QUESU
MKETLVADNTIQREIYRTKKENQSLKTKAHAIHLCFLHAKPPPPPHRSPEQKEFSPCRPLLAQTSTSPHTEAHRHRGRWSCGWSLETYRSRRDHDPKAMASIAASSEADWNAMKMREKELAAVKIKAADVDIIANELELDPKVAERTLREHNVDAVAAIRHLLR